MTGKNMSWADFTVTKDLRVCYQNFQRQCYEWDLKSEMLRTSAKYKLEEDAVPKIVTFAVMNNGKFVKNVAHINSWVRYSIVECRTRPDLITQIGAVEEFSLRL